MLINEPKPTNQLWVVHPTSQSALTIASQQRPQEEMAHVSPWLSRQAARAGPSAAWRRGEGPGWQGDRQRPLAAPLDVIRPTGGGWCRWRPGPPRWWPPGEPRARPWCPAPRRSAPGATQTAVNRCQGQRHHRGLTRKHTLSLVRGLGSAALLQLAFLGESDPNFPSEKSPLGQQSGKKRKKRKR